MMRIRSISSSYIDGETGEALMWSGELEDGRPILVDRNGTKLTVQQSKFWPEPEKPVPVMGPPSWWWETIKSVKLHDSSPLTTEQVLELTGLELVA